MSKNHDDDQDYDDDQNYKYSFIIFYNLEEI